MTTNHSDISRHRCKKIPMYANRTMKTSTIMGSHCKYEAVYVSKMNYLSCKNSFTLGSQIKSGKLKLIIKTRMEHKIRRYMK